jgi:hypothetical protein
VDNNYLDLGMSKSGFIHTLPSGRLTGISSLKNSPLQVIVLTVTTKPTQKLYISLSVVAKCTIYIMYKYILHPVPY